METNKIYSFCFSTDVDEKLYFSSLAKAKDYARKEAVDILLKESSEPIDLTINIIQVDGTFTRVDYVDNNDTLSVYEYGYIEELTVR